MLLSPPSAPHQARVVSFRCNVCGSQVQAPADQLSRESDSCTECHSTVRMRSIVHLVSVALFGKGMAIGDFPLRPDLRGVGLSDWDEYARRFAQRVSYTNTFYHQEPFLDITAVPEAMRGTCDFVISTDVFEHVEPPVERSFEGAFQLLRPGGTLVFTVPFMTEERETREHFPTLHDWKLVETEPGQYKVVNTRADGQVEEFHDLVFHGGPGTTLEMRLFAREALVGHLHRAGFVDVAFQGDDVPEFGIVWQHPWSIPITARKP